jgi:hypothetical protein
LKEKREQGKDTYIINKLVILESARKVEKQSECRRLSRLRGQIAETLIRNRKQIKQ